MKLVVLGLSLSSSWGNGHATTYRALLKSFADRGHEILFLERDVPWYRDNRDCAKPDYCRLNFYRAVEELAKWRREIESADAVIVGSYVPDGVEVGRFVQKHARGVTAFYDIDTPVTLAKLERGDFEYLAPELIPTSICICRSPADRPWTGLKANMDRPRPAHSTARWTLMPMLPGNCRRYGT